MDITSISSFLFLERSSIIISEEHIPMGYHLNIPYSSKCEPPDFYIKKKKKKSHLMVSKGNFQ